MSIGSNLLRCSIGACLACGGHAAPRAPAPQQPPQNQQASSSAVLAQLPDGVEKRHFIIDCTNCHQVDVTYAYPSGTPRSHAQWATVTSRMLGFAGAATPFPIMWAGRHSDSTGAFLARYLTSPPAASPAPDARTAAIVASPNVLEYLMPSAQDLPHDIAIDSSGAVVVTGMFSHTMHVLDTVSGSFAPLPIPLPNANPRAVEIAANGDWWVLLGGPNKVARFEVATARWSSFDIGMYGHSIALDRSGKTWFNRHFTRDPELIGFVDAAGATRTITVPRHPTMAGVQGGPIPYELRIAPDRRVWMSELQGNRIVSFDPANGAFKTYDLPTPVSASRRFDIDEQGVIWIPAYAANALVRFDPRSERFSEYAFPVKDAVPYVALAYGASPGIPARIARLRP